ncbi:MAG: ABC transporter substrate-binding protein [Solirubrobacteraceae bacterium]
MNRAMDKLRRRRWRTAVGIASACVVALAGVGCGSSKSSSSSSSSSASSGASSGTSSSAAAAAPVKGAIRVGIESDCAGSFGAFYQDDIGGAQAVFAQYGGKPQGSMPSNGMTGIKIGGHPIQIVGYGCADSTAAKGLSEARRLVEQDHANVLIGPLSGDEGIAVANYSKTQPGVTFINGISGAQQATLDVRSPNFFRFNPDGAMWNAGLGDYAYHKLGWRTAATIGDDYDFPYTSVAGFVAEFCAIGGTIEKRIWPPLGTTDYSSYIAQIPKNIDGLFVSVGGSGLVTFLKQYQQVNGPLNTKKIMGNTFWPDPTLLKAIGTPMVGAVAANGTAGDSNLPATEAYKKVLSVYPSLVPNAASVFVLGYWAAAQALAQALQATPQLGSKPYGVGSKLDAALSKVVLNGPYGKISLDKNRQAIFDNWVVQITKPPAGTNVPGIRTIEEVPNVNQTFGGFFSPSTPPPSRTQPTCVKKTPPPWVGNEKPVSFPPAS